MMKRSFLIIALLLVAVMALSTLTGCSSLEDLFDLMGGSDYDYDDEYSDCNHKFGEIEFESEPNCVHPGHGYAECKKCGYRKYEEVPPSGEHVIEVINKGTPATCTEYGYTDEKRCIICDNANEYSVEIPPLGHNFVDKKCTVCGEPQGSEGLIYSYENGMTYVSGIGECTELDIIIPSRTPEGETVYGISDNAFTDCYDITSVYIPSCIEYIGIATFADCHNLKTVTFADNCNLHTIEQEAFWGCESLTEISIPDSVELIGEYAFEYCDNILEYEEGVYYVDNWAVDFDGSVSEPALREGTVGTSRYFALEGREYVTSIVIPESLKIIGNYSFYDCYNLTEVLFAENSKLESIGICAFQNCYSLTSISIPESVEVINNYAFDNCTDLTYVSFEGNSALYCIGEYAFNYCDSIVNIIIPKNVESIGYGAFYECTSLENVSFEANSKLVNINGYSFAGCANLSEIIIPNSVTYIGRYAFERCYDLESITLPEKLESLYPGAFQNCTRLEYIALPKSLSMIEESVFNMCSSLTSISIPESITSIGNYAFAGCTSLSSVIFEGNSQLTEIHYSAFNGCDSLTSITLPENLEHIGDSAFTYCDNLVTVNMNDGLISIGESAFYECYNLSSVNIPDSISCIGKYAFYNCNKAITVYNDVKYVDTWAVDVSNTYISNLTIKDGTVGIATSVFSDCYSISQITLPDSLMNINSGAFAYCDYIRENVNGVIYVGNWVVDCDESVKNVVFRDGTVGIADYAFYNCNQLIVINIPDSIQSIGQSAFADCYNLKSINIPEGITCIKPYTFENCYALTKITLPSTLLRIDNSAFRNCDALTSITLPESLTEIGAYAFAYSDTFASITIPARVERIESYAFYDCYALEKITFKDASNWYSSNNQAVDFSVPSNNAQNIRYSYNKAFFKK